MVKVKNLQGTGRDRCDCNCTSWLEHWKNISNKSPSHCGRISCNAIPVCGGHVKKVAPEMTQYIIPLCYSCNNQRDLEFYALEEELVRA